MGPPGLTVAGPVLTTDTSAVAGGTITVSMQSGWGMGSSTVLLPVAWPQSAISVPGARPSAALTVMVKVFVSPTVSVPASQVTVPAFSVHSLGSDVTVTSEVSRGSETSTSVATSGPWLVTLSEYVNVSPADTVAGPDFATSTSATGTGGSM